MSWKKNIFLMLLLTGWSLTGTAMGDGDTRLDLKISKIQSTSDSSGWRFQILNYGSQPVSLSSLEIHLWVHSVEPLDVYNWVAGDVMDGAGKEDREVQGVTASAIQMTRFLANPLQPEADWQITVKCSDPGLLPAGGRWQGGYFSYHLDQWAKMPLGQDYSQQSSGGPVSDYYENPTVGLYEQGALVSEWKSPTGPDPKSGVEPLPIMDLSGIENYSSPIVSPLDGEQVCGHIELVVRTSLTQWQIQWSRAGADSWNNLSAQANGDAWFANWDTRSLTPGSYQIRLWDSKNQESVQSLSVKVGAPQFSQSFVLPSDGIPGGLALSAGNLYVLDQKNQTIQAFSSTGTLGQALGGYGTRLGELNQAFDLASDANGTLYVADEGNGRVQILGDSPCLLGDKILSHPTIVKTSASGIYVLDGSVIHRFDDNGKYLYSGRLDPTGAYGDMAVDDAGRIYGINLNTQCIDVYSPSFLKINSWTDLSQKWIPAALSFAFGRLWMADSVHNMVVKLGLDGNPLASWGGYGLSNEQFDQPFRVLSDGQDGVYVSDVGNNRVQKFVLDSGNAPVSTASAGVGGVLNLSGFFAAPNPFNPNLTSAAFTYQLSQNAAVHLSIQNESGTLIYQQDYPAGNFGGKSGLNQLTWTGTEQGTALPIGTYQVMLQASAGGIQATAQLALGLTADLTPVPTVTPIIATLTPAFTNTPMPGIPTATGTVVPATPTPTNTVLPILPIDTNTPLPATPIMTDTPLPVVPTDTPIPSSPTGTDTPIPPVPTNTPIVIPPTDTPVPPMPTHTPVPPTPIPTYTPVTLSISGFHASPSTIDRLFGPANVYLGYNLTEPASMTLQLENSYGGVVFTQTFSGSAGANDFIYVYPGVVNPGQRLPAGSYTFVLTGITSGGTTGVAKTGLIIMP